MSLPRGEELEQKIAAGEKARREKQVEQHRKAEEARLAAEKEANEKLEKEVADCRERIESVILYAINNGERHAEIMIPSNSLHYLPAWEKAMKRVAKSNPEYKLTIGKRDIDCDNAGEAANVDYVTFKQWTETVTEIKITW
jgi:hypothetical protein